MASAGGFGGFGRTAALAVQCRAGRTALWARKEIVAAEQHLDDADEWALGVVSEQVENDSQAVAGIAAELRLLEKKLAALGPGSAMEQPERKLAVARAAVEKLGRSELSPIKTMKQPPPTIKGLITAVCCLLNVERVIAPRFDVERAGGDCCQGLLGRRDFTLEISNFDVSQLYKHPELLDYVSTNFIGERRRRRSNPPRSLRAARLRI
jgi:hypothetical protein